MRLMSCCFLVLAAGLRPRAREAETSPAAYSGTWALDEKLSEDPAVKAGDKGAGPSSGGGWLDTLGGTASASGSASAFDLPLEVIQDMRRLVVEEEGGNIRVAYLSGRKRILYPDGVERQLDDGDGPAKTTTTRKGATLVVSSKWPRGNGLTETWQILPSPRRLVITTKVKGRSSFTYKRTYEPAQPVQPAAQDPTPTPTPAARLTPDSALDWAVSMPPPTPVRSATPAVTTTRVEKPPCSIRPPRGASGEELARMAKLTRREAEAKATASVAPAKVSSIISSDVEVHEGCLVFPFDLRLPERGGVQEVMIDAGNGNLISSELEATTKD
jgi:hypothetical protein